MNKKSKSLLAAIFVLIVIVAVSYITLPSKLGSQSSSVQQVELAAIIASPQSWQGQNVRVSGYFNLELEGDAIYLSEMDRKGHTFKNSVALALDSIGAFNETESLIAEILRIRNLIALRTLVGHPVTVEGYFTTGGLSSGVVYVECLEAR